MPSEPARVVKPITWILGVYLGGHLAWDAALYFIRYPDHFALPSYQGYLPLVLVHLAGGILTLLLGPLQFVPGLRNRYPRVHRYLGRLYLLCVLQKMSHSLSKLCRIRGANVWGYGAPASVVAASCGLR